MSNTQSQSSDGYPTPLFKLKSLILERWYEDRNDFIGRVLTIVDSSIQDPQQRKAMKDLMKSSMHTPYSFFEVGVRNILLDFAEKHAKDIVPDTKESRESFLGIFHSDESVPRPLPYFK